MHVKEPRRIVYSPDYPNIGILVGGRSIEINGKLTQASIKIVNGNVSEALKRIQKLETSFGLERID